VAHVSCRSYFSRGCWRWRHGQRVAEWMLRLLH